MAKRLVKHLDILAAKRGYEEGSDHRFAQDNGAVAAALERLVSDHKGC